VRAVGADFTAREAAAGGSWCFGDSLERSLVDSPRGDVDGCFVAVELDELVGVEGSGLPIDRTSFFRPYLSDLR